MLDKTKVVHNMYLSLLSELGLVGLVLFLFLVVAAFASIVRALRQPAWHRLAVPAARARLSRGVIAILVAYTFATAEYEKQLWLLLGSALALPTFAPRMAGTNRDPDAMA